MRHLKRAALDFGSPRIVYVASRPRSQRVAVVGAGPAGIQAAWELGVRGYSVTVFEQEPRPGGLMRTIPAYRMTDADIQTDRVRLRDLDVTFVTTHRVGEDGSPEKLLDQGYQAVFLSVGTPAHRALGIEGENLAGVIPALELLKRTNYGASVSMGRKVVVVGGGDVAMDAVRSALRLSHGGEVTLVYRRSRAEMPADAEEIHGAEHEGIRFLFQRAPLRILGHDRVVGIVVQSIELGPPDADGRRSPLPVPGSEATIDCDTLIVAVGQKADLRGFGASLDLRVTPQGWPEGKGHGFATGVPGVFAAGGRSVVYAMGSASLAAEAIDAYLCAKRGAPVAPRPDPFGRDVPFKLPAGYTTPIRK
ncbi:MAG: FAD-dependent oxidoreductase [Thermoplasmata archaeon]